MLRILFRLFGISCCAFGLVACGAFADATGEPDGLPTMTIDPFIILQGQTVEFTNTFNEDPPWAGDTGGTFYISRFDMGDDIEPTPVYYGLRTVVGTLYALPNAKATTRRLEVTVTYVKFGQKQQNHSGWCWLTVVPKQTIDGGSQDGGDL
ncbi:MAG: hypothetical protein JRJ19_10300 [Deltaproteobacteria bacterium]|nr:hypothetical protein [Deltaproteobacteria bacterium]